MALSGMFTPVCGETERQLRICTDLLLVVLDLADVHSGDEESSATVESLSKSLSNAIGTMVLCFPDVSVEVIGFTDQRVYVFID